MQTDLSITHNGWKNTCLHIKTALHFIKCYRLSSQRLIWLMSIFAMIGALGLAKFTNLWRNSIRFLKLPIKPGQTFLKVL